MSDQLIPDIGAIGIFVLKTPYDTEIAPGTSYSCQAIRKLSDIIGSGSDPFEVYYQPFGIPRATYNNDITNGVCIVSLLAGIGQWVYVPSSFILSYPIMNGVTYRTLMLGVNLGPLPDGFALAGLKSEVSDTIYDLIGVRPSIKEAVVSAETLVPKVTHDGIETARLANVTITMSKAARIRKLQSDLGEALTKISQLETYIKANLPPP